MQGTSSPRVTRERRRHPPMVLSVSIDGAAVGRRLVRRRGPFEIRLPVPAETHGRRCEVEPRSLWTWRPDLEGDERRLSCLIDSVEFR